MCNLFLKLYFRCVSFAFLMCYLLASNFQLCYLFLIIFDVLSSLSFDFQLCDLFHCIFSCQVMLSCRMPPLRTDTRGDWVRLFPVMVIQLMMNCHLWRNIRSFSRSNRALVVVMVTIWQRQTLSQWQSSQTLMTMLCLVASVVVVIIELAVAAFTKSFLLGVSFASVYICEYLGCCVLIVGFWQKLLTDQVLWTECLVKSLFVFTDESRRWSEMCSYWNLWSTVYAKVYGSGCSRNFRTAFGFVKCDVISTFRRPKKMFSKYNDVWNLVGYTIFYLF